MDHSEIDTPQDKGIMTCEEVALYLQMSESWVYKNWRLLGGVKLGGSLRFPSKEDLYERLFGERERVEVRLHPEGRKAHKRVVQDQKGGSAGGSKKARRASFHPETPLINHLP
jgi:hypothetical protein